jgi:hypothetical protein
VRVGAGRPSFADFNPRRGWSYIDDSLMAGPGGPGELSNELGAHRVTFCSMISYFQSHLVLFHG